MEIDEKFEILLEFIEDGIILKSSLISLFRLILSLHDDFIKFEVYNEEKIEEILVFYTKQLLFPIENIKNFEQDFLNFLSQNSFITDFLIKNDLDESIIRTPLKFQNEFFDLLVKENKLNIDEIEGLRKDIRNLELERAKIVKLRYNIKQRLREYTKCYICFTECNVRLGIYPCKKCFKFVCSIHLFAGGMCINCSKRYIEKS